MVTKVGLSSPPLTSIQRTPLPKVTKVALGALAFFVLCITAVVVYRNSRQYKIGQVLKELPEEVKDLFGGEEKVRSYPFHQLTSQVTVIANKHFSLENRFSQIIHSVNQMSPPVVIGIDQWGDPFVCLRAIQKSDEKRVGLAYYRHEGIWYVNKNQLFQESGDMNGPTSYIQTLIRGEESTVHYPLRDLEPPKSAFS